VSKLIGLPFMVMGEIRCRNARGCEAARLHYRCTNLAVRLRPGWLATVRPAFCTIIASSSVQQPECPRGNRRRSPSSDWPVGSGGDPTPRALRTAQTFSKSHLEVKVQQLLAYLVSAAHGAQLKGLTGRQGRLIKGNMG